MHLIIDQAILHFFYQIIVGISRSMLSTRVLCDRLCPIQIGVRIVYANSLSLKINFIAKFKHISLYDIVCLLVNHICLGYWD